MLETFIFIVKTVETAIEVAKILTREIAFLIVFDCISAEIAIKRIVFRIKQLSSCCVCQRVKFVTSFTFSILPLSTCCHYEVNPARITFPIYSNCKPDKLTAWIVNISAFTNFEFLRGVLCKHIWKQVNLFTVFDKYNFSTNSRINHFDLILSLV